MWKVIFIACYFLLFLVVVPKVIIAIRISLCCTAAPHSSYHLGWCVEGRIDTPSARDNLCGRFTRIMPGQRRSSLLFFFFGHLQLAMDFQPSRQCSRTFGPISWRSVKFIAGGYTRCYSHSTLTLSRPNKNLNTAGAKKKKKQKKNRIKQSSRL